MPVNNHKKHLVIVESPAKAKTITRYLGNDYNVLSSFGHIRDLPKKGLNIDTAHDFTPTYEISPDKKKVVTELRRVAKASSDVYLASDEDREGEAIAWHLCIALGLNPKDTKRIVFHEITKGAIEQALEHPRTVDIRLVDAQQARRILDRLVGYELSPVLWKKIRTGLSAGRVQSVAVRLIVEREREIKAFSAMSTYKVSGLFEIDGQELKAQLDRPISTQDEAHNFLETASKASFIVDSIEQKPGIRNPSAPFTTSTLQQEAARKLNFSVRQTMVLAQHLYESGYITYMRTDSTTLSDFALNEVEKIIKRDFGDKYHQQRQYKATSQRAQEAHEAIRPTNLSLGKPKTEGQQQKLYDLIRKRTLASQMAAAKIEKTEVTIKMSNTSDTLVAKGEVLQFDGFLKVYGNLKDDQLLPPLKKGRTLSLSSMLATESFSRPAARYSEAMLVKKLEELGIGRPSTYAPTVSIIQTRGYVEKKDIEGSERIVHVLTLESNKIKDSEEATVFGEDRNKLVPTPVASITTDFLMKYFADIVDYDFTARVENSFDKVADGEESWVQMIKDFYASFHPLVEKSEEATRQEVSQARLIGKDPKSKRPIFARYGRYGPMLQRGETKDEQKPDFAPMPENATVEAIALEQALTMFTLPRSVGKTTDNQEIKANIGRYGPYIQVGGLFISLKEDDPFTITQKKAQELYEQKLSENANKYIQEFSSGIKIVNGPYGPYITNGKKNARVEKDVDPKTISEEDAKKYLTKAPVSRFRKRKRSK